MNKITYSTANHVHCLLKLNSGRTISLLEFHQRQTYAGLLEGTPSKDTNKNDVIRAVSKAMVLYGLNATPYLVQPQTTKHLREPGDMDHIPGNAKGYRPTEWMPMVACSGYFTSEAPVKLQKADGSHLVIVWYQGEFGLPSNDFVENHLSAIDWDNHASNYEL